MTSLHQFTWTGEVYSYGACSTIPKLEITGAPDDADWSRWGMAYTGKNYQLFCFQGTTRNTLYPFGWNGNSYEYCFESDHETLCITDIPEDADMSEFDMLHDGETLRFYVKRLGATEELYQFALVDCTNQLRWGEKSIPAIKVIQFPTNSDHRRWFMYHDGNNYVYSCLVQGKPCTFYSGAFNDDAYQFGHRTKGTLAFEGGPEDVGVFGSSMLYTGDLYAFYLLSR